MWAGLLGEQLIDPLWVETNDDLVADYHRWSGAATIFINQIAHRLSVFTEIAVFKLNTSAREVGLYRVAGWSTRLAEYEDAFALHTAHLTNSGTPATQKIWDFGFRI